MKRFLFLIGLTGLTTIAYTQSNVGIGTNDPKSKLDVKGGITIGDSYSGVNAAPANGAIIEGQVGIGTNTPNSTAILDINSTNRGIRIPSVALVSISNPISGTKPDGLMVYNTSTSGTYATPGLYIWNQAANDWKRVITDATLSGSLQPLTNTLGGGLNTFSYNGSAGTSIGIANDGITNAMLQDNVVTTNEISNGTITSADLATPAVNATNQIFNTLPVGNGGTGTSSTPANGQILIGNGTNYTVTGLTPGTGIGITNGSGSITINNTAPDQTVTLTGGGINTVSGTYPNFTVTGTEVDGSVTNEGSLTVGAGTASTSVINSNTSGSTPVTLQAGSNVTLTETGNTITIASSNSGGTVTNVATGSGLTGGPITTTGTISVATGGITSAHIADGTVTGTDIADGTVTSTDITDGTITSADISNGTIAAVDLANTGVTAGTYNNVTVNAQGQVTAGSNTAYLTSEVDGNVSNEGSLTVGVGTATTSLIQSNTSGSTPVTITAGSNITLSEAGNNITISSSNPGGTVTQVNTGAGLTGGPITGSGTISIANSGVTNAMLANSAITVNTSGVGLSVSGSPVSLGGAVTVTSNGTSNNTANTLVARDASGNFSAGQVNANLNGQWLRIDDRTIAPSDISSGYARFGFTSWNNNNSSPYADFLHLRSYTDATGGNDNLVVFRKDVIGMRIYQQAWNSATPYSGFKDVAFQQDIATGYIQNTTTQQASSNFNISGAGVVGTTMTAATYQFPAPAGDPSPVITARTVPVGQGNASEKTELILFHANDGPNGSGNDQITLRAPALSFQTYNNSAVGDINNNAGYNERMYINPDGNVGIGTTGPGYKLDVVGAIRSQDYGGAGSVNVMVGDDTYLTDVDQGNIMGLYSSSNTAVGGLQLGSNTGSLVYGSGGNIGIGTTGPSYKLHVNGYGYFEQGVQFRCSSCGSTGAFVGASDWGNLTIQGRVLSANSNIHLSPPGGSRVIINSTYRAAGGGTGTTGLDIEDGGIRMRKNYRWINRYGSTSGYGWGSQTHNLGAWDFCAVGHVGFRNTNSTTDEDDDVQCAVYPNVHADAGESNQWDSYFTYQYNSRPNWYMYLEGYADTNATNCAASCINFD